MQIQQYQPLLKIRAPRRSQAMVEVIGRNGGIPYTISHTLTEQTVSPLVVRDVRS